MNYTQMIIAKRYAQAFFNVYGALISPEQFETVCRASRFFQEHRQTVSLLRVPHLSAEVKKRALEHVIIQQFGFSEYMTHLIALLINDKRSYLIGNVLEQLCMIYKRAHGIEAFTVVSAYELDEQARLDAKAFLAQQTGKKIVCHYVQSARIIAGIRMHSKALLWEYSAAKQIRALRSLAVRIR